MLRTLLSFVSLSEEDYAIIMVTLIGIIIIGGYLAICAGIGRYAKIEAVPFGCFSSFPYLILLLALLSRH